jgi:hypothetical protein
MQMKIAPILGCIAGAVLLGHVLSSVLPDGAPLWLGLIVAFVLAALLNAAVIVVKRKMGSKE